MNLSSDASVLCLFHEGITNYDFLLDFVKKSIEHLPATCKETIHAIIADQAAGINAEPEIPGANLSSISICRLIISANATAYYTAIGRAMSHEIMHYNKVLKNFKVESETYQNLRDQDEPDVPWISDKDGDCKVIKWVPIFLNSLTRAYGIHGPLVYLVRKDPAVPDKVNYPLEHESYFGASASLNEELVARLVHAGAIYKNDNTSV